ncbi:MAG: ABC transporter permease [Bacteroidota bacterium]
MWSSLYVLWKRELLKFVRERSRVIGALVQPLGFWLMLGFGFQGSFQVEGQEGMTYLEFLFPGIIALMVLFTAIFSTISVIEERKSGFLQAALVAPIPRTLLALGTTLGGTTLAVLQAVLFLLLLPAMGLQPTLGGLILAILTCFLLALAFTAMGVTMAWRMETTRGFHAVMNLVLLPLWLLSGAFFPVVGAASGLEWAMRLNPVTYAVNGLQQALYLPFDAPDPVAPMAVCVGISAVFALAMVGLTVQTLRRPLFETA